MAYQIMLTRYNISSVVFNDIVQKMEKYITVVPDVKPFYYGYHNKQIIYYDNKCEMIMQKHLLAHFCGSSVKSDNDWAQCIVSCVDKGTTQSTDAVKVEKDVNGIMAYNYIKRLISQYYTDEEYNEILNAHSAPRNEELKQFHYNCIDFDGKISVHKNCVKYDINGAHTDALCELFPKCKNQFVYLYNKRKEMPEIKKYFNYFVGMLVRKGYVGAYNWIVQRTTKLLMNAINTVGGRLVYANTDGFIARDPKRELTYSTKLGEFKLEYAGTVYSYTDKNYQIYQYKKDDVLESVGNTLVSVRHLIDLSEHKVVHYNNAVVEFNDKKYHEAQNIQEDVAEWLVRN